ncbi:MAG TPA: hypothetical protein VKX17_18595 [Planctomycetota bacterium]|nr:hypothetical protein [Planctomycetota bacterium]
MQTLKEKLHASVEELPAEISMEDAIYRLYVMQHIARAEDDIANGRVMPHEEAMKEIRSWVSKSSGPKARLKTSKKSMTASKHPGRHMQKNF